MGLPKRTINEQKTKNGISYMFRYGHQDSLKLFNLMYKDVDKGIYLERKYIKFIEGIKQGDSNGTTNRSE